MLDEENSCKDYCELRWSLESGISSAKAHSILEEAVQNHPFPFIGRSNAKSQPFRPSRRSYPRLKAIPSAKELGDVYTPNLVKLVWEEERTREPAPRVGLLVLLKNFQCLGYFVPLAEVSVPIVEYVAQCAGYASVPKELPCYAASSAWRRHMLLFRDYVGVKPWGQEAQRSMERACHEAARTLEDLPDIINVMLEQLVRQRFELPAFSVLHRTAQHARALVNRGYQSMVCDRLGAVARQ